MERVKSKNVALVYDNTNKLLNVEIVKMSILNVGEQKKNNITIQDVKLRDYKIEVRFNFTRKSNYALSSFNIYSANQTFTPKKISLKKSIYNKTQKDTIKNCRNTIINEYIVKIIIDEINKDSAGKSIQGKYLLLSYENKPDINQFLNYEEFIIWNTSLWFILIKFKSRIHKRTHLSFLIKGNTLLSISVLNKYYYNILLKIIKKNEDN